MKNLFSRILLFFLFVFSCASSTFAQKVGEKCASENCDPGLHCVTVKIKGSTMKLYSECSQSELKAMTAKVNTTCK